MTSTSSARRLNLGIALGAAEPVFLGMTICSPSGLAGMFIASAIVIGLANLANWRWPGWRLDTPVLVIGMFGLLPFIPLLVGLATLSVFGVALGGHQLEFVEAFAVALVMGVVYLLGAMVLGGFAHAVSKCYRRLAPSPNP